MNIDISNKAILALFFLYLVLISGVNTSLLNCDIQKLLHDSLFIRHFIVFLSIFIFTFILNWYTPQSLVIKENMNNEKNELDIKYKNKYKYVKDSFLYSIIIYIIFVFSSKQEHDSMYRFLVILLLIISLFIFYRIEKDHLQIDEIKTFFISKNEINKLTKEKNINEFYILHNTLSILYFALLINLVYGVSVYMEKQIKDKKSNFNIITFFFGTHRCRNTD